LLRWFNIHGGQNSLQLDCCIMGFLAKLFGFSKSANAFLSSHDPEKLLREATSLKKSGDIEGAILKLKSAYRAIAKTNITWSVNTFIRLPQYLQIAGSNDNAWREFNKLLLGYPNQLNSLEVLPMDHSIIYDKMRLFLQREKRYKEAILFGVFSYLCWIKGLYLQKRKREAKDFLKQESIASMLDGLLKKAKMTDMMDEYKKIILEETKYLPDKDLSRVKSRFKNANMGIKLTR
jgi:hypothetical protein